MKSLYEQYKEEFMASSQEYCCYCGHEKTNYKCCNENHFVTFADMDDQSQKDIIDAEIQWAFQQEVK